MDSDDINAILIEDNESEFINSSAYYLKKLLERDKSYNANGFPVGKVLFSSGLQTIKAANATAPEWEDVSATGYDRIKVNEILGRNSTLLTIVNLNKEQTSDNLYIIYSAGEGFSNDEIMIPIPTLSDMHYIQIMNVYEVRLRSPTKGVYYQIFEGNIG